MTSTLDQTGFRDALSRFASGVTIVLTRKGSGAFVGFTASAFSSVSLEPPLVLVCLQKDADSYPAFMDTDAFTVSILAAGQGSLAKRFATKSIDKLDGVSTVPAPGSGIPCIEGASAWLDCRMHSRADGGDHTILIGEVLAAGSTGAQPLVLFDRNFGRFDPA
jgi:flavin reductase ActVB